MHWMCFGVSILKNIINHFWHFSILLLALGSAVEALGDVTVMTPNGSATIVTPSVPGASTSPVATGDDVCQQFMFAGGNKYQLCMDGKNRAIQTLQAQFTSVPNSDHPCHDGMQPGPDRQRCAAVWQALRQQLVDTVANSVQCYDVPSYDTLGNAITYQSCAATNDANPFIQYAYGNGSGGQVADNFRAFLQSGGM